MTTTMTSHHHHHPKDDEEEELRDELPPPPSPHIGEEAAPFEDSIISAGLVAAASIEAEAEKRELETYPSIAQLELDNDHLTYLHSRYAYRKSTRAPGEGARARWEGAAERTAAAAEAARADMPGSACGSGR